MSEKVFPIRLDKNHREILDRLSQHWQASRAEVVRKILVLADKAFLQDEPEMEKEAGNVSLHSLEP